MFCWQSLKHFTSAWVWVCFTFLIGAASRATFGDDIAPTDGTLIPGDQSGSASCWLNKGGPFYLLGLGSNETIHWTDTIFCGGRLQLPEGWKIAPIFLGYSDNPGTFYQAEKFNSVSGVNLHCKVIQGNVKVDVSGYSVPLNPGQDMAVDYQPGGTTDDQGNTTYYIYWRFNAPAAPVLSRQNFTGNAATGQDMAIALNSALPEILDVKFTSLNTDAKQDPQDCIVAFYLELVVDEFHMRDYLLNTDGSVSVDGIQNYNFNGISETNDHIGLRATILRGHGVPGLVDLGQDPTKKLDDFGQKLVGLKDYLSFDSISKDFGASGDNSALFSVTALQLPGITIQAGNNTMQTPSIALVDDFTWDEQHLTNLGLNWTLKTFRTLMFFVFAYYTVLRFWRVFNH